MIFWTGAIIGLIGLMIVLVLALVYEEMHQ